MSAPERVGYYTSFAALSELSGKLPSATARSLYKLCQQFTGFFSVIGQNYPRPGAADTEEGFHHYPLPVDPVVASSGLDHGIFAGDLVWRQGKVETLPRRPNNVQRR